MRENLRGLRENLNTKSEPKDCSIAWPRPLPVIIPTADTEIASGTVLPPTWHITLIFRQPYLKSCIIWTKCTRVNSICYICGRLRKQNWSSVCSFEFLNKIVKRQVMSDINWHLLVQWPSVQSLMWFWIVMFPEKICQVVLSIAQQSSGSHLWVICQSYFSHLAVIWQSSGSHLAVIWQ